MSRFNEKLVAGVGQNYTYEDMDQFESRMKTESPDHASFNFDDHLCVTIPDEDTGGTISVNYRGRKVTFSFVGLGDGGDNNRVECVDIKVHNTPQTAKGGNGQPLPIQHWILFRGGRGRFDSRSNENSNPEAGVTLATLLLRREYYGD